VTQYKFSKLRIEEHTSQIGVDVRPIIEVRAERQKLTEFGLWLTDKWPTLFENVVQGPAAFFVTKKFVFPGKGEAEQPTFILTQRGPVFIFPHKFGILPGEDVELPDSTDVVIAALDHFHQMWPQCKQVRMGVVTIYTFECEPESPVAILAARFTRIHGSPSELMLQFNLPTDDHNRVLQLQQVDMPVLGAEPRRGIRVQLDFNNTAMDEDLSKDQKLRILHDAGEFCEQDLLKILNAEE
jgi:hypothetical protein